MSNQVDEADRANPMIRLYRRSSFNRPGYRYTLEASGGFYCLTLVKSGAPTALAGQQVPIPPHIFGTIVEYIYTNGNIFVPIRNLIELFAAADLLELDELTSQLTTFFRENSAKCLETEEFLMNEPLDDVLRFLTECLVYLDETDKLKLIGKLYVWAERHSIEFAQVDRLIRYVRNSVPCLPGNNSAIALGRRWPHTTALMVTANGLFHGITRYPCSEVLARTFSISRNPILIFGDEVFMNLGCRLSVYGLVTGLLLRSSAQLSWVTKLVFCNDRVYTWNTNEIYEVTVNPLLARRLPFQTRETIDRVEIVQDDEHSLKLYYGDTKWCVYIITCDADGREISEKFIRRDCYLIGVHGDAAFIWTSLHELKVMREDSCIYQYDFFDDPSSAVSCGCNVYLKFAADLKVVTTDTHRVSVITHPPFNGPGRLIVKGTFQ